MLVCPRCYGDIDETATCCPVCGVLRPDAGWSIDPWLGTTVGGRFDLIERLSSGGMGLVYRAARTDLDGEVAVKIASPLHRGTIHAARFEREAALAARLTSPHAVRVLEVGALDDGLPYMVMELVKGRPLDDYVALRRPMPAAWVLSVVSQVSEALGEAHALGLVHRDIKPANVMITGGRRGHAKLLDWGVAHSPAVDDVRVTATGCVSGTPWYMSPEQAAGREVDGRADLYSLGVMAFELLAGRPLFDADAPAAIMQLHAQETPALDGIRPPSVRALVGRLLAKDPADRPASAADLLAAIEATGLLAAAGPDPYVTAAIDSGAGPAPDRDTQVWTGRRSDTVADAVPVRPADAPPPEARHPLQVTDRPPRWAPLQDGEAHPASGSGLPKLGADGEAPRWALGRGQGASASVEEGLALDVPEGWARRGNGAGVARFVGIFAVAFLLGAATAFVGLGGLNRGDGASAREGRRTPGVPVTAPRQPGAPAMHGAPTPVRRTGRLAGDEPADPRRPVAPR